MRILVIASIGVLLMTNASPLQADPSSIREPSLQDVLLEDQRSRLQLARIWVFSDTALVAILHPRSDDGLWRDQMPLEEYPPWYPPSIPAFHWRDASDASRRVLRRSTVILVLRHDDGTSCTVNELDGERILTESNQQQILTAFEMPCVQIWNHLESAVPEVVRLEAQGYLATPLPARDSSPESSLPAPLEDEEETCPSSGSTE